MAQGYYRFPTIQGSTIAFVCEEDIWTVPAQGGVARRLTSGLAPSTSPLLSPDGKWLAFTGFEEGQPEIYLMPAVGGQPRRLTFLGASHCAPAAWNDIGLIFASNAFQPFSDRIHLYSMPITGGEPAQIPVGPAHAISFSAAGLQVIGRNTSDLTRWKRYHGGTAGQIWIDRSGSGDFQPLIHLNSDLACPMWLGDRIYFISDHEGVGNIYSCLPDGSGLQRHTHHEKFYTRNARSDGHSIVYHAGADIYRYDLSTGTQKKVLIKFHSPQNHRNRRFVEASTYLEDHSLHPKGHALACTARGRLFAFSNWEGPVLQLGELEDSSGTAIRYRLPNWLNDGERLIAVSDEGGEENFVIFSVIGAAAAESITGLDVGRTLTIRVNPQKDVIAFTNHRNELFSLDLVSRQLQKVDQSRNAPFNGFTWSPDGEWLAYCCSISLKVSVLRLWNASSGVITDVCHPLLEDASPSFDPSGRYLYFLSRRIFNPVYDNLLFDLSFPRGEKPYLVTLQKDLPSPFIPQSPLRPRPESLNSDPEPQQSGDSEPASSSTLAPDDSLASPADGETGDSSAKSEPSAVSKDTSSADKPKIQIDLEGIQDRMIPFPVDEARYGRIVALTEGMVILSSFPVEGALEEKSFTKEPQSKGRLWIYNFKNLDEDLLFDFVGDFQVARDAQTLAYTSGDRIRVVHVGEKPEEERRYERSTGWINLNRMRLQVFPGAEWRQMFREAWRLQRDHFWTPDMSSVDWTQVHDRYLPLVDRVSSRAEFSDLVWEMQGELGTSHAYEFGGDYRTQPHYPLGLLGATFYWNAEKNGWQIQHIVRGDPWDPDCDSPLAQAGVNLQPGAVITHINGRPLNQAFPPSQALVNQAHVEVLLTVIDPSSPNPRFLSVTTLSSEMPVYYRQWVESNRQHVHQVSDGKVGYVHIPDMGARGYAEFHRHFLAEFDHQGLIIDVRHNGGGHVSSLILEKLSRKRIGYGSSRWEQDPTPYPRESVLGPMVVLMDETTASDGDIFSHGFKLMGLGKLIGKRTWGGVIGIWPRHTLVDGSMTTQPEYSFWFKDVGWGVENYGADPDIEVENRPQDHARSLDVQLETAITEIIKLVTAEPPGLPDFGPRPNLSLPRLNNRG